MNLPPASARHPCIGDIPAVILAAGLSRRAAPDNKLLLPDPAGTVVRATVAAFCAAAFGSVLVVTGHEHDRVEAALAGLPVRFIHFPGYAGGMGASLAAGIRAAPPGAPAFAVSPGDLPHLTPALVRRIAEHFCALGGNRHVIPTAAGSRGHPVVIGGWLRGKLSSLDGDTGARHLLAAPSEAPRCALFETGDPAIAADTDRPPAPATA